ncbi:hypothetical protein MPER_08161 [Moniliophthora perniciosa FA553]|nr:hypothetical protein MPER_08161 [Moniliophthora perniciosa FA553]
MDLNISFSSKKFSPYCPYSKRVLELEQDIISRLQAIEKNGTRCVISWIEPEPLPPPGRAMNASNANSDSDDNDSENESSDGDDSDSEDESDEDFSDEEDDTEDSDDEAAVLKSFLVVEALCMYENL